MLIKNRDIAKLANVSTATVSLVINHKPGVSDTTRNKVFDIINQISNNNDSGFGQNLTKNGSIRFLKYKKHGMVVDDNGFVASIIDGVEIEARVLGYDVVITNIFKENRESVMMDVINDSRDGVILLGTELFSEDLGFLKKIQVPIVIVDNYFELEDYDCVVMNNEDAVFKAIKYLYNLGFREIGHFKSSVVINNFSDRREGYIKALTKLGLSFNPEHTFELESTFEGSYRDMTAILSKRPKLPTAIFSDNDTIAVGAIKALKESGLKIPKDVSIVGFDDIPFCTMIEPALSTVRIFKEEIGVLAVKRLVDKMKLKSNLILKIQVGAELIKRKSAIRCKLL